MRAAGRNLDVLQARDALRRQYFDETEFDALFADQQALDRYTLARLEIERNPDLTEEQRRQALAGTETELDPQQRAERAQSVVQETVGAQTAAFNAAGTDERTRFAQRSARFGDWLYMRTIHDGFRLLPREMLFNLKDDPHEEHNVADQHPDLCAYGARLILNWQEEQMLKSPYTVDPMWTVMRENGPYHTWNELSGYIERLKKTGRAEGAQRLQEAYKDW